MPRASDQPAREILQRSEAGMPQCEVAEQLGITYQAVQNTERRALAKLRKALEQRGLLKLNDLL